MREPLNKVAIAVGIAVDVVLSVVLVLGVAIFMFSTGMVKEDDDAALEGWLNHPGFLAMEFVLSVLPTVLAGFIAGRMAKREQTRHALWVGVVMLALYAILTFIPMDGPSEPLWFDLLSLVVVIPAALAGGHLSIPRTPATR
jgi:hypothetical protein